MNSNQGFTLTNGPQTSTAPYLLPQRSGLIPRSLIVESSKDGRGCKNSGASCSPLTGRNQQRLNQSDFYGSEHKRDHVHLLTLKQNEKEAYLLGLERAVLEENRNIKQHNNFLKGQIKVMFQREKKYKGSLQASKLKAKQLQGINALLQSQLQTLFSKIIGEIQRIQRIIDEERWGNCEELLMISRSGADTPRKSMELGSETESTIHHNLEDLKARVSSMAKYAPFDLSNDDLLTKPTATLSTHEKDAFCQQVQSILTHQNSAKDGGYIQIEKQDIFQAYLPMTKLIKNDSRPRDKRNTHRKN